MEKIEPFNNINWDLVSQYNKKELHVYEQELFNIWKHGWIDIEKIEGIDNLGAYLTHYLKKGVNDIRLREEKAYLRSNNLEKPKNITDNEEAKEVYETLKKHYYPNYAIEGENVYTGKTKYQEYNLKKADFIKDKEGN